MASRQDTPDRDEARAVGAAPAPGASELDAMIPGGAPAQGAAEAGGEPVEPLSDREEPLPRRETASAAAIALPELDGAAAAAAGRHFGLLLDVGVEVAAVVGTRELKLEQVLAIQPGMVIDLERSAGEPIELYVNGKPIALAEIVVVDGRLGARVVETLDAPGRGAPS